METVDLEENGIINKNYGDMKQRKINCSRHRVIHFLFIWERLPRYLTVVRQIIL